MEKAVSTAFKWLSRKVRAMLSSGSSSEQADFEHCFYRQGQRSDCGAFPFRFGVSYPTISSLKWSSRKSSKLRIGPRTCGSAPIRYVATARMLKSHHQTRSRAGVQSIRLTIKSPSQLLKKTSASSFKHKLQNPTGKIAQG